jgi:hypothetical protein
MFKIFIDISFSQFYLILSTFYFQFVEIGIDTFHITAFNLPRIKFNRLTGFKIYKPMGFVAV